jgi:hypothetical protein
MREKFNHMYLDSHERKLLIHSLVELKNQLIQQGRLCFVNRKCIKMTRKVQHPDNPIMLI